MLQAFTSLVLLCCLYVPLLHAAAMVPPDLSYLTYLSPDSSDTKAVQDKPSEEASADGSLALIGGDLAKDQADIADTLKDVDDVIARAKQLSEGQKEVKQDKSVHVSNSNDPAANDASPKDAAPNKEGAATGQTEPQQQPTKTLPKADALPSKSELDAVRDQAFRAASAVGDAMKQASDKVGEAFNEARNSANDAAANASSVVQVVKEGVQTAASSVHAAAKEANQDMVAEKLTQKESVKKAEAAKSAASSNATDAVAAVADAKSQGLAASQETAQQETPAAGLGVGPVIGKAQKIVTDVVAGAQSAFKYLQGNSNEQQNAKVSEGKPVEVAKKEKQEEKEKEEERVIDPSKDASTSRSIPTANSAKQIVQVAKQQMLDAQAINGTLVPSPSPALNPSPSPAAGSYLDRLVPTAVPEAFTRYVAEKTFITGQDMLSGSKTLTVRSTVGFLPAFPVQINEGGLNSECAIIKSISKGIELKTKLKFSHGLGEEVVMINPLDAKDCEKKEEKTPVADNAYWATKLAHNLGKRVVASAGSLQAFLSMAMGVCGVLFALGYVSNLMMGQRGLKALPLFGRIVRAGGFQRPRY